MPAPPKNVDETVFDWQDFADCAEVDPSLWFVEKGGEGYDFARAICKSCAVRVECLDYALRVERERYEVSMGMVHGMYGGLTPQERVELHRVWVQQREGEKDGAAA